jgi:uncharacterized protein YlxW (UPF0749 family)
VTDDQTQPEQGQETPPEQTPQSETSEAPPAETSEAPPAETHDTPPADVSGRERLVGALRRPHLRGQVIAAALLAVVGFAGVVQVEATQRDDDYEGWRQEDLIQLLNSLDAASQRTQSEIAQLERTRSSLQSDTNSRRAALEQARQQANVLGILAGTLPATGPGVRVTVRDPHTAVSVDHLLNGLEELRDAGAEAIEVNDTVRVVAQTALEDGPEGGIVVGGQTLTPPYTIEAIGDEHTLATALDFTGGFTDEVEDPAVGGRVVVEERDRVQISTLREPAEPQYARPSAGE